MIGLYAHHHGSGHLHRARVLQSALAARGEPAQILSSHPSADVLLPDDVPETDAGAGADHPTAHGSLHYAPLGHAGLRARMARIAAWVEEQRPRALYVDVSVEVAVLARLMGVPTVALAMPGIREDAPHQLGYRQASAILAAWPRWVELPSHLHQHADRVHAVGGISRFAGRTAPPAHPHRPGDPLRVLVLSGAGGSSWTSATWRRVEAACPQARFTYLGGTLGPRSEDPFPQIAAADVVISAAGQNSIADLAVARARTIVLAQARPFGEQAATAALLAREGLAVVPAPGAEDEFPPPERWPLLLEEARALTPDWSRWETDGAADRAAGVIASAALPAASGSAR